MALLEVTNIKKIYSTRFGGNKVQALSNVTFSVEEGEFVAIMGESGSGKTTLLNILASLDRPTSGEVLLEGKNIVYLTEKEISAFRRKNLGFVFQEFNLLDTFNVKDNILLPLVLKGENYKHMDSKLQPIAKELGICSESGRPHDKAVSAIIQKIDLFTDEIVKTAYSRNGHDGVTVQYKESVLEMFTTHLAMAAQRICTGQEVETLDESIWNEDAIGADNTVAVHIRHIREKIEINPKEPRYLKVVWGVGYKIDKN